MFPSHAAGSLLPIQEGALIQELSVRGSFRKDMHISSPCSHSVIQVEAGAEGIIFERLSSEVASHSVEIFLGAHAKLTFVSMQDATDVPVQIRQRSRSEAQSSIHWYNVTTRAENVSHELTSQVEGVGATSNIDWIFYAKGNQKQSLSACNIFNAKQGSGEINMKGVAEGSAYVRANGLIDIGLQGGGTDTYLTEEVLMLDKTAKVDAIPGLEIKTNDVKASHSATVSNITEADLFYFATRGLQEELARPILLEGFLDTLLMKIPDPDILEQLRHDLFYPLLSLHYAQDQQ